MNALDYFLLIFVACLIIFAVWLYRRGQKNGGCHGGGGCCGNCESCKAACKKQKKNKKDDNETSAR